MTPTMAMAALVAQVIERNRLPIIDEKATQARIAELLQAEGIDFEREARLSDDDVNTLALRIRLAEADIPDFMVGDLAVEVKLKGSKPRIFSQLARYADHGRVKGVLLVTAQAMGLPREINGKPARMASLCAGWL